MTKDSELVSFAREILRKSLFMSGIGMSPEEEQRFFTETDFLTLSMPELVPVRNRRGDWKKFGEAMAARMERDWGLSQTKEASLWNRARLAVHEAITGNDPKHAAIRLRLRKSPAISNVMLADLSLWLAGEMKTSVSVTKRLVAVMLLGVSEAKGDWNVLGE